MILVAKQPLDTRDDVRKAVQRAIELEHATIPPYLTAWFSVDPQSPQNTTHVQPILKRIVVQEMRHLGTMANVLNAIGGEPAINSPDFIPVYPGGLPFHIGSADGKKFEVGLRALSTELVHDTFMVIEEPEKPLDFPVKTAAFGFLEFPDQFQTIGEFYAALSDALDASMFISDASRQVGGVGLPVITGPDQTASLKNARAAIQGIVQQGEGTPTSPLQVAQGTAAAHYYLFAGIFHGKALVRDTTVPEGFSYSGTDVSIDPNGVFPLLPDPTVDSYAPGSAAFQANLKFNSAYSALLDSLHDVFNGNPSGLDATIGMMTELTAIAAGGETPMVAIPVTSGGQTFRASPTYTYVPPAQRPKNG